MQQYTADETPTDEEPSGADVAYETLVSLGYSEEAAAAYITLATFDAADYHTTPE